MSYSSTNRIQYFYGYDDAKKWHDMTKPLRGSTPPLRPLAARRDKHMQIRENAVGNIECILYETPVVTFNKEGTVTISPGKWPGAFTCSFVSNILHRVGARTTRNKMVLNVEGTEYTLDKDMVLEIKHKNNLGFGGWEVVQATGVMEWQPNRAKANNVRANYSEFIKYYKGIISMLSESVDKDEINERDPFEPKNLVRMQPEMLSQVIGTVKREESVWTGGAQRSTRTVEVLNMEPWRKLLNKPVWHGANAGGHETYVDEWQNSVNEMLALMRNDQPSETKHENFYKAAIVLFASEAVGHHYHRAVLNSIVLSKSKAMELANDFILKAHAEEVMERVTLPVGRVPSGKYGTYLFNSFRKEHGEAI